MADAALHAWEQELSTFQRDHTEAIQQAAAEARAPQAALKMLGRLSWIALSSNSSLQIAAEDRSKEQVTLRDMAAPEPGPASHLRVELSPEVAVLSQGMRVVENDQSTTYTSSLQIRADAAAHQVRVTMAQTDEAPEVTVDWNLPVGVVQGIAASLLRRYGITS